MHMTCFNRRSKLLISACKGKLKKIIFKVILLKIISFVLSVHHQIILPVPLLGSIEDLLINTTTQRDRPHKSVYLGNWLKHIHNLIHNTVLHIPLNI